MGKYGEAFAAAVAQQLQAERTVAKLSQRRLSELVGISEQSVMRYLNGTRDIPMPALADLAEALGLSVETIIERAVQRIDLHDNVIVGGFGQNAGTDDEHLGESWEVADGPIEYDGKLAAKKGTRKADDLPHAE